MIIFHLLPDPKIKRDTLSLTNTPFTFETRSSALMYQSLLHPRADVFYLGNIYISLKEDRQKRIYHSNHHILDSASEFAF